MNFKVKYIHKKETPGSHRKRREKFEICALLETWYKDTLW